MLIVNFADIQHIYDERNFAAGTRTVTIVLKDGKTEKITSTDEANEFLAQFNEWLAAKQK